MLVLLQATEKIIVGYNVTVDDSQADGASEASSSVLTWETNSSSSSSSSSDWTFESDSDADTTLTGRFFFFLGGS